MIGYRQPIMQRLGRQLVLALLLVLGLSACGAQPMLPTLAPDHVRQQQVVAGFTFTLDTAEAPLINQTQQLLVTLTDRQGAAIADADVYFDMEMDMICLSGSKPIADPSGNGSYAIETVYPMPGDWRITVYATVDGNTHQALFATTVTE
ncbi:MAG: FixH family protein [Chloroflexales bacterium]|nr:FixH family protein [Chloroflexales bacterium]